MKRKILLAVSAFLLSLSLAMGISACSGVTQSDNAEFKEYEAIVQTVLEKTSAGLGGARRNAAQAKAFGREQREQLFAYLEAREDKEEAANLSFYNDVFEQSLYLPLIGGYCITQFHGADKFYDVNIALPFYGQYIKTISDGTKKISYGYSDQEGDDDRSYMEYIVMEIDYKSESDFEFRALQFSADLKDALFLYGNSSLDFLAVSRSDASGEYVLFNLAGGEGYAVYGKDAVDYCYAQVESEFTETDLGAIRAVKDSPQYTLQEAQWQEASEQYLGNSSSSEMQPGKFDIVDGVLYGWTGREEDCPEEVVLPSDISSVYYSFSFPGHVKKLVIPSSITSVKISEWELGILQGENEDKDVPTGEAVLVECPARYLDIYLWSEGARQSVLEEISLQGASSLFTVQDHCLYSADGTLLYIPQNEKITSLTLDAENMSSRVKQNLTYSVFPSLRQVNATLHIVENETDGDLIDNPLEPLFATEYVQKEYALESVTLNGIAGESSLFFGEGLLSVQELSLRGSECTSLSVALACRVRSLRVGEGLGSDLYIASEQGGRAEEISLPADVQELQIIQTGSQRLLLPWSVFECGIFGKSELLGIRAEEFLGYGIAYDAEEFTVQSQDTTLVFRSPAAEDEAELEKLKNFPQITRVQEGKALSLTLEGFYGTGGDVSVPEDIYGVPVLQVILAGTEQSAYGTPNFDGIEQLYVPSSLQYFYFREPYSFGSIRYEGTRAAFYELYGRPSSLYQLLKYTPRISCSDGEIDRFNTEKQEYVFAAEGVALTVKVDRAARRAEYVLEADGITFRSHQIENGFTESYDWHCSEPVEEEGMNQELWVARVRFEQMEVDGDVFEWVEASLEKTDGGEWHDISLGSPAVSEFFGEIVHEYEETPFESTVPDCVNPGKEIYRCKYCDHIDTVLSPELGHVWGARVVVSEPTCTESGESYRECGVCFEREYEYENPLGHVFAEELSFDENEHWYACTRGCGAKSERHYHIMEEEETPATCTQDGVLIGKCSECEYAYEYLQPAFGHTQVDVGKDEQYHWSVCGTCGETYNVQEHDWQEHVYPAPDCTGEGRLNHYCSICDYAYSESVPALGHDTSGAWEKDYQGHWKICSRCWVRIEQGGHVWDEGVITQPATHIYGGVIKYTCTVCGYEKYEPIPHEHAFSQEWSGGDATHWHECVCGEIQGEEEHVLDGRECTVCGHVLDFTPGLKYYYSEQDGWYLVSMGEATEKDIVIPAEYNGVRVHGILEDAFAGSDITSVRMEDGIWDISSRAFKDCTSLVSVTFPAGLQNLYEQAFSGCTALASVTLPSNLYYVGFGIFENCTALTFVSLPENTNAFRNATSLFSGCTALRSVVLPQDLTAVPSRFFSGCTAMESFAFYPTVTEVGDSVFSGCTALRSVTLPAGLTKIGYETFLGCISLSSLTLPQTVTEIRDRAFEGCTGLTELVLPQGVSHIGDGAFRGCLFESFELPENVTFIGAGAFENCVRLGGIRLPDGVTEMGTGAFRGCSALAFANIPASLTLVSESLFEGCSALASEIVIPACVTQIGISAFSGCTLLPAVTFAEGSVLQTVENFAFQDCTSLTSMAFPESTQSLYWSMQGCTSIQSLVFPYVTAPTAIWNGELPESLMEVTVIGSSMIGENAFRDCIYIQTICIGADVPELNYWAFWGCTGITTIEYMGDLAGWLTLPGATYLMQNAPSKTDRSLFVGGKEVAGEVVIPQSVTTVPAYIFAYCTKITSVVFHNDVEEIQESALAGCSSVVSLSLPFAGGTPDAQIGIWQILRDARYEGSYEQNIRTIRLTGYTYEQKEVPVLSYLPSLENLYIGSGFSVLGDGAVVSCDLLKNVYLIPGLKKIESNAFVRCPSLTSLNFNGTREEWEAIEGWAQAEEKYTVVFG